MRINNLIKLLFAGVLALMTMHKCNWPKALWDFEFNKQVKVQPVTESEVLGEKKEARECDYVIPKSAGFIMKRSNIDSSYIITDNYGEQYNRLFDKIQQVRTGCAARFKDTCQAKAFAHELINQTNEFK